MSLLSLLGIGTQASHAGAIPPELQQVPQQLVPTPTFSSPGAMNMPAPQAAPQAPPPLQEADQPIEALPTHKGLFGLKGTARDILGVLGDGLTVGYGGKAIYAPRRAAEKAGDAGRDMMTNPIEAVKRLNQAGFPEQAQALYKDYAQQQYQKGMLERQTANDGSLADQRRLANNLDTFKYVGGFTAKADASTYPKLREQAAAFMKGRGMTDQEVASTLPATYDPTVNSIGTTAPQQYTSDFRDRNLAERSQYHGTMAGVAQQNAGTNAGRLAETREHNDVTEDQGQQRIDKPRAGALGQLAGATSSPPPFDAASHKGKVANGPTGKWKSDGKKWIKQ